MAGPGNPRRSLFWLVLMMSMLCCDSDEFSWALIQAVYFSLRSVELSESMRACRRIKAEDLGLPGRRRNGHGGVVGDQVEGIASLMFALRFSIS